MSQSHTPLPEFNPKEPIPGYPTTELIGRGGYGEVWRAIAPGGLAKAIKIVYGGADSERAAIELKALARIKDVRHPLLLSIERIEIAGGNLVIVAELADCSLKDYFISKRKADCVGVPQEELLRYLKDAAEALDFLYGQYSLQHLDVKPENILLLAGRAKIGDFGLVKNLYERATSVVGGLTPAYSPPELFEGKPTRHSDQYSLAVVYVQMLTGALPFNGTNAAQLAKQHLQEVPDLSGLPRRQRPVIARALSKDPAQRFENCSAMMSALEASVRETLASSGTHSRSACESSAGNSRGPSTDANSSRASLDEQSTAFPSPASQGFTPRRTEEPCFDETSRCPVQGMSRDRAADRLLENCRSGQPVLIVGVGGTAVEVVANLVERLRDRIGDEANWPPVQIVLLDSDTRALTARFKSEGRYLQLVPIRLRSAESLGPRSQQVLKWLGRRWFYSIPRDLTTGGYRPLGRLALVTNGPRVKEALSAAVAATARQVQAQSPAADAPQPARAPRVMVVGSICGGTGAGALLDLAYSVRSELKRQGMSDDDVQGVLLHSTPRGNVERDKSLANAYATLTELNHYSRAGNHFPGEGAIGAVPFHGDNATFARTQVLHLGQGLSEPEWKLATEKVAEFLYCSTFTPAGQILDEWQKAEIRTDDAAAGSELSRPISVWGCDAVAFGVGTTQLVSHVAKRTCVDVVNLWREGLDAVTTMGASGPTAVMTVFASRSASRSAKTEMAVKQKLAELQVVVEQFVKDAHEVVKLEAGCSEQDYISQLVQEALAVATDNGGEGTDAIDGIISAIDQVLGSNPKETDGPRDSLYDRILARLAVRESGRATGILEWIRGLVDSPALRVEGARLYATTTKLLLQEMHERLSSQANELHQSTLGLCVEARDTQVDRGNRSRPLPWPPKRGPRERLCTILKTYAGIRLKEALHRAVSKQLRLIEADVATLIYQLDTLSRSLKLLAERLQETDAGTPSTEEETAPPAAAARYQEMIVKQLGQRRRDIAREVEEAIDERLFRENHGLRRYLEPESELWKTLIAPLTDVARQAVLDSLREIVCRLMRGSGSAVAGTEDILNVILEGLASEEAVVSNDSGSRILVVPTEVDVERLRERLGAALKNVAIVTGCTCDLALLTVQRGLPLQRLADGLIGGHDVFKDLANRLHSRIDVQWSSLVETKPRFRQEPEPILEPLINPTAVCAIPAANGIGDGMINPTARFGNAEPRPAATDR